MELEVGRKGLSASINLLSSQVKSQSQMQLEVNKFHSHRNSMGHSSRVKSHTGHRIVTDANSNLLPAGEWPWLIAPNRQNNFIFRVSQKGRKHSSQEQGAKAMWFLCILLQCASSFFSAAKLCHSSNGNSTVEINGAHHRSPIYSPYCTKKSHCPKARWCLLFVCTHLLSDQFTVNDVYMVIYLIIKRDFQNLTGHQKFAGSKQNC